MGSEVVMLEDFLLSRHKSGTALKKVILIQMKA